MESIKFSVIVPVYKVELYIRECIESVLHQTYQNYELILVDDGSPDNSGLICDEYKEKSDQIVVYHKPNAGLLHTRRFGIAHATGDYYVFLDSDDSLKDNALQVIYQAITKYSCDCVIYEMDRLCNGNYIHPVAEAAETVYTDKRDLYKKCFFSNQYNSLCRKAVRSTLFTGTDYSPYYKISFGEDLLQSIEIIKNTTSTAFIPDILYNYRVNLNSMTQTVDYNHYSVDFTVRQKVIDFLREENVFTKQDFDEYRGYCAKMICDAVCSIGMADIPKEKKIALYREISQAKYYTDFVNNGRCPKQALGKKAFLYSLFVKERYSVLLLLLSVINAIRK